MRVEEKDEMESGGALSVQVRRPAVRGIQCEGDMGGVLQAPHAQHSLSFPGREGDIQVDDKGSVPERAAQHLGQRLQPPEAQHWPLLDREGVARDSCSVNETQKQQQLAEPEDRTRGGHGAARWTGVDCLTAHLNIDPNFY